MIKVGKYKQLPCLTIKVVPGSSRNAIQMNDGQLKILISASPEKGKANQELIAFLAKQWKMSKSDITIAQGETSRTKILVFSNETELGLQKKLEYLQKSNS